MAGGSSFSTEREARLVDLLQKLLAEHSKEINLLQQEIELGLQARSKDLLEMRRLLNDMQSHHGANHEDHEDREATADMQDDFEQGGLPERCSSGIHSHPDSQSEINKQVSEDGEIIDCIVGDGATREQFEEVRQWTTKHKTQYLDALAHHPCQRRMHGLVQSMLFETCCAVAILTNVALMGMSVDHIARNESDPDHPPKIYLRLDHLFCAWFVLEILCKLGAFRAKFFYMEGWAWNLFDLVVVGTDVIQTGMEMLAADASQLDRISMLRTLRVLRVTRALRVLRLVHLFRELRIMVASLMHSGASLLWSLILFAAVIYMFSVLLMSPVTYYVYQNQGDEYYANYRQYWNSLPQAMWTLFCCMTGGISWNEVAIPLLHIHPAWGCVIAFFMYFTIFALANIVTGIFVDGAIQKAESNRDEMIQQDIAVRQSTLETLKILFEQADVNKSGTLTYEEFETHLENSGTLALFDAIGIHVDKARSLFNLIDVKKTNKVTLEDFIFGFMRFKGYATSAHLASFNIEYRKDLADIKEFLYDFAKMFRALREQFDAMLEVRDPVNSEPFLTTVEI